jgi:SAM-dependent methyltransferase
MSPVSFWGERVRRYGHTGWSDAATYAYDQRLRLKAVGWLLKPVHSALDYGCGVGDFCALLATCAQRVVGHDLSREALLRAARQHPSTAIRYEPIAQAVWSQRYDLILSITVLQHVVDDGELQALLERCADALQPGGRMIVLETLADETRDGVYLKRRTQAELVDAFARAGLSLQSRRGFYHPTECPTPAFLAYRKRPAVRLLSRLAGWKVPGAQPLLARIAHAAADADTEFLAQPASPTQLLVFARRPA